MTDNILLDQYGNTIETITFDDAEDKIHFTKHTDVSDVLDRNAILRNQGNDGYGATREFRHVASIPQIMIEVWNKTWGVDVMDKANEKLFFRLIKENEKLLVGNGGI